MTRSLPRLIIHVTAVVLVLAGAAVAIASRSEAEGPPPAKPLAEAVRDALAAPAPAGVSGRLEFTNRLVDSAALPRGGDNPLFSGAEGRFWVARDGRARLELQSPAGDVQVQLDGDRISMYDPASNTVYSAAVPVPVPVPVPGAGRRDGAGPGIAGIQASLGRLARGFALTGAEPGTVAGQAAYSVRIAPRHDGGLVGAAELAWDASHGIPLRAAVFAQGEREPVLELKVTDVRFGAVAERDVAVRSPHDARVVEIGDAAPGHAGAPIGERAAAETVQSELVFPIAAPSSVAGLPRRSIRTLRSDGETGALVTYGKGLGALMVIQAPAGGRGGLDAATGLQELSLDGETGYELATALGTMVQFERDGVAYTVVGSVPPAAAEAAARAL
jgi:hypothetical protein